MDKNQTYCTSIEDTIGSKYNGNDSHSGSHRGSHRGSHSDLYLLGPYAIGVISACKTDMSDTSFMRSNVPVKRLQAALASGVEVTAESESSSVSTTNHCR